MIKTQGNFLIWENSCSSRRLSWKGQKKIYAKIMMKFNNLKQRWIWSENIWKGSRGKWKKKHNKLKSSEEKYIREMVKNKWRKLNIIQHPKDSYNLVQYQSHKSNNWSRNYNTLNYVFKTSRFFWDISLVNCLNSKIRPNSRSNPSLNYNKLTRSKNLD